MRNGIRRGDRIGDLVGGHARHARFRHARILKRIRPRLDGLVQLRGSISIPARGEQEERKSGCKDGPGHDDFPDSDLIWLHRPNDRPDIAVPSATATADRLAVTGP
jgi:hypothetical protein